MRRIDIVILGLLAFALSGCRLNRPDNVLSPKKMEQFLYDYHLAQAITQDLPREEKYTTNAYIDWAYEKNGITKDEFNASLIWYTRYPKELARIYKRLSNRIDDEYRRASRSLSQIEKKSFTIQSGDSVNMWYLDKTAILNTSDYMSKLTYMVSNDTTFHKGDTVCLNMYGTFVAVDTYASGRAYVSLSAYYGDSVSTADTVLRSSGQIALSLVLDTKRALSSISGSVNYLDSADNRDGIIVLSGMELMRYHRREVADTVRIPESGLAPAEL